MKTYDLPITHNPLKTREDFCMALNQICAPLQNCFSKGKAQLHLGNTSAGYSDAVAGMEGFSRVLWGLVPLLAGGGSSELWDTMLTGICNGVDPQHEEYWGDIGDCDQRMVEMAAYGYALAMAPDMLWGKLGRKDRDHLASWLFQINKHKVWDCNWLLFCVLVNMGLKRVGAPYDQDKMESCLARIDDFYLTGGWYSDGVGAHCDYYIPFAIHFYTLLYAVLMEKEDRERSLLYKERAAAFADDFIYWFAKDGSALPYGRSQTYRIAQSAFWGALAFAGGSPTLPMGVIKGLLLRNLRWWFQRPIFSREGLLTIGYGYPSLIVAENYNSPGSPYWGLKAFLPLAFGEDHPFWQAEELPLPHLERLRVENEPRFVFIRDEEKNHVLAFRVGDFSTNDHTHTAAKYEKFVYSNLFGFSVPRAEYGLEQGAYDSILALSDGDNLYRVKRFCKKSRVDGNLICFQWKPWETVEVTTWVVAGAPWHLRIHRIKTPRALEAADGGFALGIEGKENQKLKIVEREGAVFAQYVGLMSGIRSFSRGSIKLISPNANTNMLYPRTALPTARYKVDAGTSVFVDAVFGGPVGEGDDGWDTPPQVEITGGTIRIFDASRHLEREIDTENDGFGA